MSAQHREALIEGLETGDAIGDRDASLLDEPRQFLCRLGAVPGMAPAGDPCRVVQRKVESTEVDQQTEMLDIGVPVLPVVVLTPRRARQPAGALVEADRIGRYADLTSELADPHQRSKHWSRSDVKVIQRCRGVRKG